MNPTIYVWQVRELVSDTSGSRQTQQDVFILATSAAQAVEIVGETDWRRIVAVHEVCPLSQTPADKWRAQPVTPVKP